MNDINIRHVCEFVVLAEVKSYLEAADMLFISQSSLTRHIQKLEIELGIQLFERTTRRVVLSKFGELFLPHAKEIARIQGEYAAEILRELKINRDQLSIGSIPMMTQYGITDILAKFSKENASLRLNILEADSFQLVQMLITGQCDFAFIRDWDDLDNKFHKLPFSTDSLTALIPQSHPLSKSQSLNLEKLANEPLLLLSKDTFMYSLCTNECHKAGFEPNVVFTGHRGENIVDLVSREMGIALLMKKSAIRLTPPGVIFVDIVPRITTTISLAYPRGKDLSVAAHHFLAAIRSFQTES